MSASPLPRRGDSDPASLFAYGTLLSAAVLLDVVGRTPTGPRASLRHYRRSRVSGAEYPAIVAHPGGQVDGRLYRGLSAAEHSLIAEYEGDLYLVCPVSVLISGQPNEAITYVLRDEHRSLLSVDDWSLDDFESARRANRSPNAQR